MMSSAWPALAAGLFTLLPPLPVQAPDRSVDPLAAAIAAPSPNTVTPSANDWLDPEQLLTGRAPAAESTPQLVPKVVTIGGYEYLVIPNASGMAQTFVVTTQSYDPKWVDPMSIDHMPNPGLGVDPSKIDRMAFWNGGDPNDLDHMAFGVAPKPQSSLMTLPNAVRIFPTTPPDTLKVTPKGQTPVAPSK